MAYLDDIHDAQARLRAIANQCESMADNFRHTGNAYMAEWLETWATTIRESSNQIGAAITNDLTHQVNTGRKQIADIFLAVLDRPKSQEEQK